MSPLVQRFVEIRTRRGASMKGVGERAGVGRSVVFRWEKEGVEPRLGNFEAALNVLGYRLTIVPMEGGK